MNFKISSISFDFSVPEELLFQKRFVYTKLDIYVLILNYNVYVIIYLKVALHILALTLKYYYEITYLKDPLGHELDVLEIQRKRLEVMA